MGMPKKDPLSKQKIGAFRKQMDEQLGIHAVSGDISPEVEKRLAASAKSPDDYRDFRRIQNEREIEAIKAELAPYISNEDFEIKTKAITIYLNVMITQCSCGGFTCRRPRTKARPAARP